MLIVVFTAAALTASISHSHSLTHTRSRHTHTPTHYTLTRCLASSESLRSALTQHGTQTLTTAAAAAAITPTTTLARAMQSHASIFIAATDTHTEEARCALVCEPHLSCMQQRTNTSRAKFECWWRAVSGCIAPLHRDRQLTFVRCVCVSVCVVCPVVRE